MPSKFGTDAELRGNGLRARIADAGDGRAAGNYYASCTEADGTGCSTENGSGTEAGRTDTRSVARLFRQREFLSAYADHTGERLEAL